MIYGIFLPFSKYLVRDTIQYRSAVALGIALSDYAGSS